MKSTLSLIAAPLAGALLLTGCQTPGGSQPFPEPNAKWKTSSGQLRYATPKRAVIGEATVSRLGSEEFQLDFLTGPGVPLMRIRTSGDRMQAEGVFAWGSWNGRASRAGRLGSWSALREAFTSVEKSRAGASDAGARTQWTAAREAMAPKKERITVDFPRSKERYIFVLSK